MAEHANGMVQSANPPEMIVDVDEKAALGGELAERACKVDEGDGMECEPQTRLLKEEFYCEENNQCSGIAKEDVPNAYGLPLEGEWTEYPSSETTDSKGVELGRKSGTDGGVEPAGSSNKLEGPDGSGIPCVCLGGTRMWPGDVDGPGCGTDVLKGLPDGLGGLTDALNALSRPEMANVSHGDEVNTYLGLGDAKCGGKMTDGIENHADASTGQTDGPSVGNSTDTAENERENVRMG